MTDEFNRLPEIAQLLSGRVKIWSQAVLLQGS